MKVLAIIPARGGSKGIPMKNIINFKGKPLIQWTIDAALQSNYITDTLVSSDSDEILEVAKKNKDVLLLKRPNYLAEDSTRTEPVLKHAINSLQNKKYDYIILLQPTSPLRDSKDIDASFKKIEKQNADSLISVCNVEHHPYKTFKLDKNGFLKGIINNDFPFSPRQILPETFRANGAIYIIKTKKFLEKELLITDNTLDYQMSKQKSLDIDTKEDLI
ncbi:acylneuraminate cytidylyltransferase [Polaribacter sp. BM10]|uniref:acylneuraminate cytidylyltransferase family protein n=1 Tax=Polaribacter sp. BM10 TaxID=1529069 RepID=UPI00098A520B|nr:acylneuraminate cytidylyltransferase family protein [Polaribacter sp. BM10]AQS93263.1 acylneuraminate cytidylyltransferase [Polaribacter sp. BM10]